MRHAIPYRRTLPQQLVPGMLYQKYLVLFRTELDGTEPDRTTWNRTHPNPTQPNPTQPNPIVPLLYRIVPYRTVQLLYRTVPYSHCCYVANGTALPQLFPLWLITVHTNSSLQLHSEKFPRTFRGGRKYVTPGAYYMWPT